MPPTPAVSADRAPARTWAAVKGEPRWVQPEALNVAPHLVGAPLAAPLRRAGALGLDGLVVALLSGVGGLWLVAGLALVVVQLRGRIGAAEADAPDPPARTRRLTRAGWVAAAVLLLLAAGEAQDRWDRWRHPERAEPAAAEDAAEERAAALAEAAEGLRAAQQQVPALASVASQVEALAQQAASAASSASAPATAASHPAAPPSAAMELDPDRRRIAELEAQLREARRHKPLTWRQQWDSLWDEVASSLGWGIVYFSLLPAWWGGQTVGKKLFGLRVVELTGQPMTVMRCLKRYGGYAASLSTGGLGFVQVLWDPNRQALQDKAAHTVVLDLRAGPQAPTAPTSDAA